MAQVQTTLAVGSFGVMVVGYSAVGATGGPSPRLRLDLTVRAMSQHFRINLEQFQARIKVAQQLIVLVQPLEIGEGVGTGDGQVKLEGPLSREALRFMEGQFGSARNCQLTIELRSLLYFKDETPAAQSITTAFVPPGQWGLVPTSAASMFVSITRDDWVENVVKVVQPDGYITVEVPIPPVPNRSKVEKALKHVADAQDHYQNGNDPGVLQSCYGAFESLNPASPKAILAKVEDEEKRKHLNELLIAAKSYLHAGRHVSKSGAQIGEFAVDHRDAEFALGITKMVVSYVARLLVD